jgi:hypothetical protein
MFEATSMYFKELWFNPSKMHCEEILNFYHKLLIRTLTFVKIIFKIFRPFVTGPSIYWSLIISKYWGCLVKFEISLLNDAKLRISQQSQLKVKLSMKSDHIDDVWSVYCHWPDDRCFHTLTGFSYNFANLRQFSSHMLQYPTIWHVLTTSSARFG